jgi:hypothetical protein
LAACPCGACSLRSLTPAMAIRRPPPSGRSKVRSAWPPPCRLAVRVTVHRSSRTLSRSAAGTASSEFRGNQSPLYGDKTLPTGDDKGRHRRLIYRCKICHPALQCAVAAGAGAAAQVSRPRVCVRSKQRGWLELDLLLGEFALVKLPDYTDAQLDLWEQVRGVSSRSVPYHHAGPSFTGRRRAVLDAGAGHRKP